MAQKKIKPKAKGGRGAMDFDHWVYHVYCCLEWGGGGDLSPQHRCSHTESNAWAVQEWPLSATDAAKARQQLRSGMKVAWKPTNRIPSPNTEGPSGARAGSK